MGDQRFYCRSCRKLVSSKCCPCGHEAVKWVTLAEFAYLIWLVRKRKEAPHPNTVLRWIKEKRIEGEKRTGQGNPGQGGRWHVPLSALDRVPHWGWPKGKRRARLEIGKGDR